jgi:hypothetical protein
MLLPLAQSWPVRCCHTGTISAAVADLAAKQLRCGSCGHRQSFAPEAIVRAPRRPNGRKARAERRGAAVKSPNFGHLPSDTTMLNDRLDDLLFAK